MARIRTTKPEFWSHPIMGRLDDSIKCMALALLNLADDEGYFLADQILVRNFARPFDEDSTITRRCLDALLKVDWISVWEHPTHGPIGRVENFNKHQKIDRKTSSKLKVYFDSTIIRRVIYEDSLQEGKGKEGKNNGLDNFQTNKPDMIGGTNSSAGVSVLDGVKHSRRAILGEEVK
jgi:hypothetical protein